MNFPLAKEMGLIPGNHPSVLNEELESALLDTFCIQIINEFDLIHNKNQAGKEIMPNQYMATRYLQLQHPNKSGLTSGDGRSIWNGWTRHNGTTWDISSCGTGATCLSPATAIHQRFFQTGDPLVSYGCGHSTVVEGITDVIFSEILTRNNIASERILCVIELPGELGITVRAGQNLIRPSHFFTHLKQKQHQRLQEVTDYYISRELENNHWHLPRNRNKYEYFLEQMTKTFAEATAMFESHYIFCWLDWDGDNILADGGIIDFGSVRQFGLFYHEYKFDDDQRWSTNIKEQKAKAIYTVQTFAQLVDYINTGEKKPISKFKNHKCLKRFEEIFQWKKKEQMLWKIGYNSDQIRYLMRFHSKQVKSLQSSVMFLEQIKSTAGKVLVPDGINANILVNMRRLLHSYPRFLKEGEIKEIDISKFVKMMESQFVQVESIKVNRTLKKYIKIFQKNYQGLIEATSRNQGKAIEIVLGNLIKRAEKINRLDRITGDSVCVIADLLIKKRKTMSKTEFNNLVFSFVQSQILNPDYKPSKFFREGFESLEQEHRVLKTMLKLVKDYQEGL